MSAVAIKPDLTPETALPRLRDELRLEKANAGSEGEPRWRFYDPLRHRSFVVDDEDVKLLSLWECGQVGALHDALATTAAPLDLHRLGGLIDFLVTHHLVQPALHGGSRKLLDAATRARTTGWMWLVQRYLGMRFALWRPQAFLEATLPALTALRGKVLLAGWASLTLIGLCLAARQWDQFVGTFSEFLTPGGVLGYGVALLALKTVHELGHGYAAVHHGCRVGSMGVAVIMGMPMLYTETSDASRLDHRRDRLWIAAGGVLAESWIAGLATFAWSVLPDGTARSIAFVVATSSWLTTLVINLNPFSRFDGYYFVSDALGVENLQSRSLAYAGWATGRALFGAIEEAPESLPPRRALLFTVYGCMVWCYRLGLYVGMAALAYSYLFKLAGIVVMGAELWLFIARPVWRKAQQWWSLHDRITRDRRLVLAGAGCLVLLAILAPLDRSVTVPAMLTWQDETVLQTPENARVVDVLVASGQSVKAGQLLMRLDSPELGAKRRSALVHQWTAGERLDRISGDSVDRSESTVLAQERHEADADLRGLADREALLELRAPADGVVVDLPLHVQPGMWVRPDMTLARVLHGLSRDARGFVVERELPRLRTGAAARFVAEDPALPSLPMTLVEAEPNAAEQVTPAALSSLHGGHIPTQQDTGGREVPVVAQHRIRFVATEKAQVSADQLPTSIRGEVRVDAMPESLLEQASRHLWRLAMAEMRD